ncbi:MAG: ABC transporter permease [Bacteroidales bacterium]|nr:ABC transporter permease [Bacteroidales bacterium]
MKIISVIIKSFKEQYRNFWILLLTVSLAPFFVFIFYMFSVDYEPNFKILFLNKDQGIESTYYGNQLVKSFDNFQYDTMLIQFNTKEVKDRIDAENKLKNKKSHVLIIIPEDFSRSIHSIKNKTNLKALDIEFVGDITDSNYMLAAILAWEAINDFVINATESEKILSLKETAIGSTASLNSFDYYVPGLLILSTIMLLFSASIAVVIESEKRTLIRLKLSAINAFQFLTGISLVQIVIGIISVIITLVVALGLGFKMNGAFLEMLFISTLSCISIIAFSLILAAFTKSANEILIVGNFPFFLFMFFSGAVFPMQGTILFTIAGYKITTVGLMSPSHAISALNKIMIMDMPITETVPEIISLLVLSIIYFIIGWFFYQKRHMKLV